MGRTPDIATPLVEVELINPQAIAEIQNTANQLASTFSTEQRQVTALINQRIGRRQITTMISKLLTVADLVDLQQIKEAKAYKGYAHLDDTGHAYTINTWSEYCQFVEGRAVETIDRDLANFNALGEELFDALRQVGLGPAKMRSLRKLPDDEKSALLIVAQEGNKEAFVELAEEIISKSARDKQALTERAEKAEEEVGLKDQVIAAKSQKIDELDMEVRRIHKLPPDEQVAKIRKECNALADEVEDRLRGQLAHAFYQVSILGGDNGIDQTAFLQSRLDYLDDAILHIRDHVGIPRLATRTDAASWMTADDDEGYIGLGAELGGA